MLDSRGFFNTGAEEAEQVLALCERSGWRIFRLPYGISSKEAFIAGVRSTLPLDPPLYGNKNWDALPDSLFSGLHATDEDRIAIVWPDGSQLEARAPADFLVASDILADLPAQLADEIATVGETKQVLVLRVI